MSVNKVILIGNVGKEPEIRHLESGISVATITLATSERYKDRSGEQKEITEWHTINAWRQLADLAQAYIHKGTQIYVEGRIRSRSWDDQNGQKHYVTEIQADTIQLLGRRSDNQPAGGQQYGGGQSYGAPRPVQPQPQPQPQPVSTPVISPQDLNDDGTDDLPF